MGQLGIVLVHLLMQAHPMAQSLRIRSPGPLTSGSPNG